MRIIISSLQVSEDSSKGHLHPAIELALAIKKRGHEPIILPIPSRLGDEDRRQLQHLNIQFIDPPSLPEGIIKTRDELAKLATNKEEAYKAYHAFLIAPLQYQFKALCLLLKKLQVDIVVYDMLVYGTALAARELQIPDIGYCAGLKLVAPEYLQTFYKQTHEKLKHDIDKFLNQFNIQHTTFHYLELLSSHAQLVFCTHKLVEKLVAPPENTHLVGPLRASEERDTIINFDYKQPKYAVICFGSVLDPADFPRLTNMMMTISKNLGLKLLISSKKFSESNTKLPDHVKAFPYLPLQKLLSNTAIFIHHGGANTFSEALFHGTPQILIPLTTDQPIQAAILKLANAGFTFSPEDVSEDDLLQACKRYLNPKDAIHQNINTISKEYKNNPGAPLAVDLILRATKHG